MRRQQLVIPSQYLMTRTIDSNRARDTFRRTLEVVTSGESLPPEWIDRATAIAASKSKTYIAMLGTALLARATNPKVDPLSLKPGSHAAPGFESYSARGVATSVLAPEAKALDVDIGTRGREPLNNQPFFRYSYMSRDMVVKVSARPSLHQLGLRRGELVSLRWEDLGPCDEYVEINRTVAPREPERVGPPKTIHAYRRVPLGKFARQAIADTRERYQIERCEPGYQDEGWLFASRTGRMPNDRNVFTAFTATIERAQARGLRMPSGERVPRDIRLHDTRRIYASYLAT